MSVTRKRLIGRLPLIVVSAALMYFIPALAALGALIFVARVALMTEPVARRETEIDPCITISAVSKG